MWECDDLYNVSIYAYSYFMINVIFGFGMLLSIIGLFKLLKCDLFVMLTYIHSFYGDILANLITYSLYRTWLDDEFWICEKFSNFNDILGIKLSMCIMYVP